MTAETCHRDFAGEAVMDQYTPVACAAATQRQQLGAELLFWWMCVIVV